MPESPARLVVQSRDEPRRAVRCVAEVVEPARAAVVAMILHDANTPFVERGVYIIGYCELVDGYRHAFADPQSRRGRRSGSVRYSRTANHPADPRCPECAATTPTESEARDDH